MKEFTTAVERATSPEEDERQKLPFKIDGVEYMAYLPDAAQLAFLMSSIGAHRTEMEQVAGIIDFFVAVLDDTAHKEIVRKLLDRKDPLKFEHVEQIMYWMIEEWTGRPTDEPSGSTPSAQNGGLSLTAATPAST